MNKRELKFRAFHRETKIMHEVYSFCKEYVKTIKKGGTISKRLINEFQTINQFTGLKDKNGVDIYEGDIVKWGMHKNSSEHWHRYAVVEINPDIKFRIVFYVDSETNEKKETDNYEFHYGRFAYKDTENHLEIIGNIHENPELI